jgi:hypothetical protein
VLRALRGRYYSISLHEWPELELMIEKGLATSLEFFRDDVFYRASMAQATDQWQREALGR